jgi:tetratricopeptide (TPR) repeat protein
MTGDGKDAFNKGYNEVFSPWSNPRPLTASDQSIPFAFWLVSEQPNGNLSIKLYLQPNTQISAPLPKPQDVKGTYNVATQQITVNWHIGDHPNIHGYNVYRTIYYHGASLNYQKINQSPVQPPFVENVNLEGLPSNKNIYFRYRVVAVYPSWSEGSIPSDDGWINVGTKVSGTITSSRTWEGQYLVTGNVAVLPGVILTVNPGTKIYLSTNISLSVYGKLFANGTSSKPIILTRMSSSGTWGSILFSGSGTSGSTLNFVKMTYGTEVLVTNTSNITIQNSELSNNTTGIRFSNSSGSVLINKITGGLTGVVTQNGSNVTVNLNTIKNNLTGISYTGASSGYIGGNDIRNAYSSGIYLIGNSNPLFKNVPYAYDKNNRITGSGVYGLYINGSWPIMYNGTTCNGKQSIHSNYDIDLAYLNGGGYALDAIGVYWNGGNPANAAIQQSPPTSPVNTFPYSTIDPWGEEPFPSIQEDDTPGGMILASVSSLRSLSPMPDLNDFIQADPLLAGIQLRKEGKIVEAMDFFISYLEKNPNSLRAYTELYNCYSDDTADDVVRYFESLPPGAGEEKLLLSYLYLKQGKPASAKDVNNAILSRESDTPLSFRAQLNNFYIALYHENDPYTAASILHSVESIKDIPEEIEVLLAQHALETYVGTDDLKGEELYKLTDGESTSGIAPEFALKQNYPNPFNPATVIRFSLPEVDRITLRVYDILGRVVAVLADDVYEAGSHEITFDAARLSSGMYIYTLTTSRSSLTKKFLVLK